MADPEIEIILNLTVPKAHAEVALAAIAAPLGGGDHAPVGALALYNHGPADTRFTPQDVALLKLVCANVVTELRVHRIDGLGLLRLARERNPDLCAVLITEGPDVDKAVEAEKTGLCGRAYFDARATTDPAYIAGDTWTVSWLSVNPHMSSQRTRPSKCRFGSSSVKPYPPEPT